MNSAKEWFQRGVARQNAADFIDAINCYGRVLALGVKSFEVHYNLAFALQSLGRENEALEHYLRAMTLKPDFPQAHNNMGNIYQKRDRLEEAQASYERALALNPNLVQAQFNLGLVLKKRGAWTRAAEHFRKAWELAPDHVQAWDNLRDTLLTLRRTEEANEVFLAFEKSAPLSSFLVVAGLGTSRSLGDFKREERYLPLALDWEFSPDEAGMAGHLLGVAQYFDLEQEQFLRLYQRYNALVKARHFNELPLLPPRRTRGGKVRVGYLSPDFRSHVMGRLMIEVFERHDVNRFEIYAYSLADVTQEDSLTERFKACSQKFVNLAKLDEQQAARVIAEDDLDILVDLAGQTSSCRPVILAYKPARIQITHMGYHGSIGLDTVDYKLTDHYADLPGNENFMLEDLLPIEGCVFPFRHVEPAAEHSCTREELGLEGKVVFGEFVNILKLSPRCLDVWGRILERVENGVLAFSPLKEDDKPGFVRRTKAAGIPEHKVAFLPHSKESGQGRARYQLIDIALDTFPYSGGDTTLAALDMGVPVVALPGRRHAERITYSILKNLGVESTIAGTEDEFVDIACRLATDSGFHASVRKEIKAGLKNSVLVDTDGYVRRLENAFLGAMAQKFIEATDSGKLSVAELRVLFQEALRFHQGDQMEQAEQSYRRVLEDQPGYAPACYMLGMLLKSRGDIDEARGFFEKAVRSAPRYADAWAALGRLDYAGGTHAEAISALREALAIKPGAIDVMNDLGLALDRLGQSVEAAEILVQAVAMKPADANSHFNLGVVLQGLSRNTEAIAEYGRAILLQPDNIDAHFNLAVALRETGQYEMAAANLQQVLKAQPDNAAVYHALGEIYLAAGNIASWLENFHQFEKHCPHDMRLALYALEAYAYLGQEKKRARYLQGLLDNAFPAGNLTELLDGLSQLLYLALFSDVEEQDMLRLYKQYNEALKLAFPERVVLPAERRPGKIRLGYLSADLRGHVMGKMMHQAISRHDTSRFEVYCYSLSGKQDEWTEKFRSVSHKFVDLHHLEEAVAATLIAQDELDILVDLSAHTRGGSPGILAMKPARLQITHIASAGSVGCDAIDFKLTDPFADVPASQEFMLEKLLPMEGCVYPYRHIPPAPAHGYSRSKYGLPANAITLGAFITLLKLSARCLELWRKVMDRLPNAYLVFSPLIPEAESSYIRTIKEAGINPKRVIFIPAGTDESVNQARYHMIDIVLDPFPFGGVNGTLEALDMGVPVVTLCGKRHGERTSFSMLSNLGVTETVASNAHEYVEITVKLARNRNFLAEVKSKIKSGIAHSSLTDMDGHARNLEAAYIAALAVRTTG